MYTIVVIAFLGLIFSSGVNCNDNHDLCKSADPGQAVEKMDSCLKVEPIKGSLLGCRETVYGTKDPKDAIKLFCTKSEVNRTLLNKKFEDCMKGKNVSWMEIQSDWEENCGFCSQKGSLAKTDKCMVCSPEYDMCPLTFNPMLLKAKGETTDCWIACREEATGTRDPTAAAAKLCEGSKESQKAMETKFFKCLMDKGLTKEKWAEAVKDCEEMPRV